MVLGESSPGRVGRRRISIRKRTDRILPAVRFLRFRAGFACRSDVSRSGRSMATHVERPPRPFTRARRATVGRRAAVRSPYGSEVRRGGIDRPGREAVRPAVSEAARSGRQAVRRGTTPKSGRRAAVRSRRLAAALEGRTASTGRPGRFGRSPAVLARAAARRRQRRSTPVAAADRGREAGARGEDAPCAARRPRDPELERQKIEDRTLETWIDDGSVRDEAVKAADRASAARRSAPKRRAAEAARSRDLGRARRSRRQAARSPAGRAAGPGLRGARP